MNKLDMLHSIVEHINFDQEFLIKNNITIEEYLVIQTFIRMEYYLGEKSFTPPNVKKVFNKNYPLVDAEKCYEYINNLMEKEFIEFSNYFYNLTEKTKSIYKV